MQHRTASFELLASQVVLAAIQGGKFADTTELTWSVVGEVNKAHEVITEVQGLFLTHPAGYTIVFCFYLTWISRTNEWLNTFDDCFIIPFSSKSDQFQNSPAALPQILHHTVWRAWLFIAYSDERWLYYQFSVHHVYILSLEGWENVLFELRSERVKTDASADGRLTVGPLSVDAPSCMTLCVQLSVDARRLTADRTSTDIWSTNWLLTDRTVDWPSADWRSTFLGRQPYDHQPTFGRRPDRLPIDRRLTLERQACCSAHGPYCAFVCSVVLLPRRFSSIHTDLRRFAGVDGYFSYGILLRVPRVTGPFVSANLYRMNWWNADLRLPFLVQRQHSGRAGRRVMSACCAGWRLRLDSRREAEPAGIGENQE